jgi:hypothetical protein
LEEFEIKSFRAAFPEFDNTTKYPDAMVTFWSNVAIDMVPCNLWKKQWLTGVYLYTAHECVLAAQNAATAKIGGTPGQNAGIVTAKTVGPVSSSYDAAGTGERSGGQWNLTTYGKQFLRLARIFGAGAIQL